MNKSNSKDLGIQRTRHNDYQCHRNKGIVCWDPMYAKKQWIELMASSNINNNQNIMYLYKDNTTSLSMLPKPNITKLCVGGEN